MLASSNHALTFRLRVSRRMISPLPSRCWKAITPPLGELLPSPSYRPHHVSIGARPPPGPSFSAEGDAGKGRIQIGSRAITHIRITPIQLVLHVICSSTQESIPSNIATDAFAVGDETEGSNDVMNSHGYIDLSGVRWMSRCRGWTLLIRAIRRS